MLTIRCAERDDQEFWFRWDRHLSKPEFFKKVRDKRAYVIQNGEMPVGLMRYNLFWDSIPFCTLLFILPEHRGRGMGKKLMEHWEQEMQAQGYGMLLTSTQVDETAQHFYRKLGYKDCGGLIMELPGYEQPMEMFLAKPITTAIDP